MPTEANAPRRLHLRGLVVVIIGLATLGACAWSSEADRLADRMQDDPIIDQDLGIPGFSPGSVGRADEMGALIVDRTYHGPDQPVQAILQDRVEAAGWSGIEVRCRNDGRGFTLIARRTIDERAAFLDMAVYDDAEGDGRTIGIEVTSQVHRTAPRDAEPDPIERCE